MKLEIKHLAPYLPYKIKGRSRNTGTMFIITGFNSRNSITTYGDLDMSDFEGTQLLLRPLSDLTKEIEVNGEKFVPIKKFKKTTLLKHVSKYPFDFKDLEFERYDVMLLLFQWHFDVFGLIEGGLAIDINTLKL